MARPRIGLVSVVVPTRNSGRTLEACLESVRSQTYGLVELVVVDNDSADETRSIATRLADIVLIAGPERSAQRNAGAVAARGTHVLFVDSDMLLEPNVVADCVQAARDGARGVVIPETSFGEGFWARCKAAERRCYLGDEDIEAARFFLREDFEAVGGYAEDLVGAEDWDLHARIRALGGPLGRTKACIRHDEGRPTVRSLARKKYYYGSTIANYVTRHPNLALRQFTPLRASLVRHRRQLAGEPLVLAGVIGMKLTEFAAVGLGMLVAELRARDKQATAPPQPRDGASRSRRAVLLMTHYTAKPGTVHTVADYCRSQGFEVYVLEHPQLPGSTLPSVLTTPSTTRIFKLSRAQYALEGIASARWWLSLRGAPRPQVVIAFDALCFFHALVLRPIFRYEKIVFYSVDYSRRRFHNPILNRAFRALNAFAFRHCDFFLSSTKAFLDEFDPHRRRASTSALVRHTVSLDDIDANQRRDRSAMVYAGSLGGPTDFRPLLTALSDLRAQGVDFKLDVYGEGLRAGEREALMTQVREAGLDTRVQYRGVVDNRRLVSEVLPRYAIGVSPYADPRSAATPDHVRHVNDLTSKLVEYIGAGLPIVTRPLSDAFEVLAREDVGFLAESPEQWRAALHALLTDPDRLAAMRANALRLARSYDRDRVFAPVFARILSV